MIDVKEAVQVAKAAANDFLGQETVLQDLMLEEVELNPGDKTWAITLGFNVPAPDKYQRLGASLAGQMYARKYKTAVAGAECNTVIELKLEHHAA